LFISNAWYGHEIALLLLIDNKLRVLITTLPDEDSEVFSINNYGIHALRYIHNKGLKFNGLRVPKANLLEGDGLAIIFHDLDEGQLRRCHHWCGKNAQNLGHVRTVGKLP
jgi:alkylation response protein AidB-like acyl-CoA dehydrogenase